MKLTSPVFEDKGMIPAKYTCQGDDISPPLKFSELPVNAESLALIVDDPDAPGGTWVHWVVFNIPVVEEIKEDTIPGKQGMNSFEKRDYGGPCPPSGEHRYIFRAFALDKSLNAEDGAAKEEIEAMMAGHVIEKASLTGVYEKQ
jgi:Raf kinase inhibitor-like YbhB/YbcL family protein